MALPPPGVKICNNIESITAMATSPKGSANIHATASAINTTADGRASTRDAMNAVNDTSPITKSQMTSILPANPLTFVLVDDIVAFDSAAALSVGPHFALA